MIGVVVLIAAIFPLISLGQDYSPEHYGFRLMRTVYRGDTVDILIKSKKGEEGIRKPLFLFCQGNLPVPLIITYNEKGKQGIYNVFVFNPDSLSNAYHLAIISKPYIPLVADQKSLDRDLAYKDDKGQYPGNYLQRNLLDYYVKRDKAVIKFLRKQNWISKDKLVVAGHSEGSTIAAKLALVTPSVTELIYSGGNPMGRMMTLIERDRVLETDSAKRVEMDMGKWEKIVTDPENMENLNGDPNKALYQFSIPPMRYLEQLRIPVLVTYGSKDAGTPFNEYLRVEAIKLKKRNFTFKEYIGTEHNFFPINADGTVNYDIFNWDRVAEDWRKWLTEH